jgi:hypothetical protein
MEETSLNADKYDSLCYDIKVVKSFAKLLIDCSIILWFQAIVKVDGKSMLSNFNEKRRLEEFSCLASISVLLL